MRCLNFFDVWIEDGFFKFKFYEDEMFFGVCSKGFCVIFVVKVELIFIDKVGEVILILVLMVV